MIGKSLDALLLIHVEHQALLDQMLHLRSVDEQIDHVKS